MRHDLLLQQACEAWPGQWSVGVGQSAKCLFILSWLTITVLPVAHREHCPISCSVSVERPYNTVARSAYHRRVTRLMSRNARHSGILALLCSATVAPIPKLHGSSRAHARNFAEFAATT